MSYSLFGSDKKIIEIMFEVFKRGGLELSRVRSEENEISVKMMHFLNKSMCATSRLGYYRYRKR